MADTHSSSGTRAPGDTAGTTAATHGTDGNGDSQHGGFMGKVRERANAQLSTQKDRAIDGLGSAARAVRQSTERLREEDHPTVAGYVEQAADQIERVSKRLREKDVGELLGDAQRLARRQPALFVGSAFALGLLGARFLKSSREDDEHEHGGDYREYGRGAYRGGRPPGGWRTATAGTAYGGGTAVATGVRDTGTTARAGTATAMSGPGVSSGPTGQPSGLTGQTSGTSGAGGNTTEKSTPPDTRGRRGGSDSDPERL